MERVTEQDARVERKFTSPKFTATVSEEHVIYWENRRGICVPASIGRRDLADLIHFLATVKDIADNSGIVYKK